MFSINCKKITKYPQQEILKKLMPHIASFGKEKNVKQQIIFNAFKIQGKIHNNCTEMYVQHSYHKNCYITVRQVNE